MNKLIIRVLSILCLSMGLSMAAQPASAAFNLCNHTSYKLRTSMAVPKSQDWNVRGWFDLRPGECREVMPKLPAIRSVYVYAESDPAHGGEVYRWEGERPFCVGAGEFNYTSASTCPPNGGATRSFTRIEVEEGAKVWTHRFREVSGIPYTLRRARYAGLQRLLSEDERFKGKIDALLGRKTRNALDKAKKDYKITANSYEADGLYDALFVKRQKDEAEMGLRFCNDSPHEVWATVAYGPDGKWVSRGWWTLAPQACVPIVKNALPDRFFYYYAEARTNEGWYVKWEGDHPFCIADIKFEIIDSGNCEARGYHQARFGRVDTEGRTGWELTFREEDARIIPRGDFR